MLRNRQLTGGLSMFFFFQFLVQAGFFFVAPLYLSVALACPRSRRASGSLPLSVTLLIAAIGGIPALLPERIAAARRPLGLLALLAGTVVLLGLLDADAGPEIVSCRCC